jgi:Uma2 family endonuclease
MASMQDVQPRFGYTDLLAMPDDGRRYEIHGGELVVMSSPLLRHQIAVLELATLLNAYGRRSGGRAVAAPFDIVFDEYDVVQPDIVFFRAERLHLLRLDAVTRAAPDIAVEVLSPSTASVDRGRKMRMFARYGVPEYWIVDPVRLEIEVHALENSGYRRAQVATGVDTVRSVLLPDLTFTAASIFPFA